MSRSVLLFNAIIRTHHITSRKKIHRLKKAAADYDVDFVLIRSGGSPGIMYAESRHEPAVSSWVAAVRALRYKDYLCIYKPSGRNVVETSDVKGFQETGSVAAFADVMEQKGLLGWWQEGMGYVQAKS